ncbi:MAG: hypothetical protein AM1032_000273 [Mycoplasmataceae bacterium]|nr:MAG: hypothetical protein AM1032_000273 [Mycoplasmataceae bacterium]
MSELNMSLEYLPVGYLKDGQDGNKLRDVSSLKNNDVWLEEHSRDPFNNPRFKINENTLCTIQTSRNEKWYIAFVSVSEQVDNYYIRSYFKAFSPIDDYDKNNGPIYFDRFQEWEKDESGKWVQKNNFR